METIESTLARVQGEIPALAPLAAAFGPLLIARSLRRQSAPGWQGELPPFDAESFSAGRPLLPEADFQCPAEGLLEAVQALIPLLRSSFPGLAGELTLLAAAVASGGIAPGALWAAAFDGDAVVEGVEPQTLALVAAEAARPFVARQAEDLLARASELSWPGAACPVCGGAPHMSVLRKLDGGDEFITAHGGKRFLRCSCCASEWTYKRVSCPACGCEEPEDLTVLYDSARPFERADACTRCKSFLLCLDGVELVAVPQADAAALVMAPLEAKAVGQGFRPLATHVWSGLVT
jgi:Uncharacterized protein involved in formate dehydrogenase formation